MTDLKEQKIWSAMKAFNVSREKAIQIIKAFIGH